MRRHTGINRKGFYSTFYFFLFIYLFKVNAIIAINVKLHDFSTLTLNDWCHAAVTSPLQAIG